MSWHWSRLSILAFLVLLYASPLSSGDKGLWLSVTPMPVPLFGALPGGMPPELSIVLPDRGDLALAPLRTTPFPDTGPLAVTMAAIGATRTALSASPFRRALDSAGPAAAAPRGPPA